VVLWYSTHWERKVMSVY